MRFIRKKSTPRWEQIIDLVFTKPIASLIKGAVHKVQEWRRKGKIHILDDS